MIDLHSWCISTLRNLADKLTELICVDLLGLRLLLLRLMSVRSLALWLLQTSARVLTGLVVGIRRLR